jgi:hypothetical protein
MGNTFSSNESILRTTLIGGLVGGAIWTAYKSISRPNRKPDPLPFTSEDSFLSLAESSNELDFELQQTAEIIQSIKDLIGLERETIEGVKKRQFEESLVKAEMSFKDLFELKSRIGQEIAKSAALRSSASRIILQKNLTGDCSPFKRQRVDETS